MTLRGRVVDTAVALIVGAKIVGTCEGNLCMPFPGKETVTDARGEFQLPEGSYNTVARGQSARLLIRLRDGTEHEAAVVPRQRRHGYGSLAVAQGPRRPDNRPERCRAGRAGRGCRRCARQAARRGRGRCLDLVSRQRDPHRCSRLVPAQKARQRPTRSKIKSFRKPGYTPQLFLTQPTATQLGRRSGEQDLLRGHGDRPRRQAGSRGVLIRATPGRSKQMADDHRDLDRNADRLRRPLPHVRTGRCLRYSGSRSGRGQRPG